MAGSNTLRFDIIGDSSSASKAFKDTAAGAALAARGAKQLADSLGIQSKSAQVSASATVSLAKSDDTLSAAMALLAGSTDEATDKLQAQGRAAEDTAVKTRLAGDAAKSAGEGFGGLADPMGAAVVAGVALAPVVLSVGTGLGGLALAASSAVKPILDAGTATAQAKAALAGLDPEQRAAYTSLGALKTQFSGFSKALEPEVLGVFNKGLGLASGLLGDIEPVAASTGKALGTVVGEIGADLKTQQWTNFFSFMQQTAGPDVQLLGTLFIDVGNDIATITPLLQPLATGFLKVSAAAAVSVSTGTNWFKSFINGVASLENRFDKLIGSTPGSEPFQNQAAALTALGNAAKASAPAVGTLGGDMALLHTDATDAATALSAYSDAWTKIVGSSLSDQQAVLADESAFSSLTTAVKNSGSQSLAARTAFVSYMQQVGSSISTLQQNGASVGTINTEYETNIKRLQALHNLTPQQRADVQGLIRDYNTWATSTAGLNKNTLTAAETIKNDFTANLKALGEFTPTVNTDVNNLANAVLKTGTTSAATRGDRTALIADLEKSGLSAQSATQLVNRLQGSINGLRGKTVDVAVHGSGSGTITVGTQGLSKNLVDSILLRGLARGGKLPGYGGGDRIPAMLEAGEAVVPKHLVPAFAPAFGAAGIPGFAAGGLVGLVPATAQAAGSEASAVMQAQANAVVQAQLNAIKKAQDAALAAQRAAVGGGPLGVGTTAGEIANGTQIYNYLLRNLFGGNRIAAAGATASIWGESTWNPFAQGTGGRGLIGWTPPSTISDAAFYGGMATQLPEILNFVVNSGDEGVIASMFQAGSVLQAANEWGVGVERFGINDVHPEGIALASQIAGLKNGGLVFDNGGTLAPGANLVWNKTGRPEPVIPAGRGGGEVHVHLHNQGVIGSKAELTRWLHSSIDELARNGRLSYALQRSPSALNTRQ